MVYFYHILHTYSGQHSLTTGMWNHLFDRHGFTEIFNCSACCGLLAKILITLEPYGIVWILSSHWYAKRWRGFAEHHLGRSRYFSETAQNSWTVSHILIKVCILIHYRDTAMQNGETALPRIFYGNFLSLVLQTCVLIMLKCFRTRFRTEPISERLCWSTHSQLGYPNAVFNLNTFIIMTPSLGVK